MGSSVDCAMSSLLCAEDCSIFEDTEFEALSRRGNRRNRDPKKQRSNGGDGLPLQAEECVVSMIEREIQYWPNNDYLKRLQVGSLDLNARKEAIDWIAKVHAHYGFGPLCAYLSINYLDRFLSSYELPKGKAWMMQLLAVACLSLAAKMDETDVPLCLDLQVGESKFVFEARTIQKMELLVLTTLQWRMQAVTPFSYLDHFLHKISDGGNIPDTVLVRAIQLISSTVKGIDFLEFKPSEIAAAVSISVAEGSQTVDAEKAVLVLTQYVQKERVLRCAGLMQELWCNKVGVCGGPVVSSSSPSAPQSPIGVLDAACMSYKSDDGSCASYASGGSSCASSSSHSSPGIKRRKLNSRPCEVEQ